MRRSLFLTIGCAALLMLPPVLQSQPPGGGKGKGGRAKGEGKGGGRQFQQQGEGDARGNGGQFMLQVGRQGGMMGGDPMRLFDRLSNGKDVINRADLDGWQQMMFDGLARAQGITGGQLTREQFRAAMGQMQGQFGGGLAMPGGGPMVLSAPGGGDMRFNTENSHRMAQNSLQHCDANGA